MSRPLSGFRIVEVASHVFVPIAGGILSEWGADVIKVEDVTGGDPYRGLSTQGLVHAHHGADPSFFMANRGKRSIGIDLKNPTGRDLLGELLGSADVFLVSLLPATRAKLRLEVQDVRADNPSIVYVRGSGYGPAGAMAGQPSFDMSTAWARSGMQHMMTSPDADWPAHIRPAFGDITGGMAIAAAICAALAGRSLSGEPSVVDVALLATGMWQVQPDIVSSTIGTMDTPPAAGQRWVIPSPLVGYFRTADRRFVTLAMLSHEQPWAELCTAFGHPEQAGDPRFATPQARAEHHPECRAWLDEQFGARTLAEVKLALADFPGAWSPVQTPAELQDDPEVRANGYLADVDLGNGHTLPLVTTPAQFDEEPNHPTRAPEHAEHTEEILLELGRSWEDIAELKAAAAVR